MALTASVSRVLSSSTTSESTKSSSCQAVLPLAIAPASRARCDEAKPVIDGRNCRHQRVERRRCADRQPAVAVARHVELDRAFDLAAGDMQAHAGGLVGEVAAKGEQALQDRGERTEGFVHVRYL